MILSKKFDGIAVWTNDLPKTEVPAVSLLHGVVVSPVCPQFRLRLYQPGRVGPVGFVIFLRKVNSLSVKSFYLPIRTHHKF